MHKTSYLKMKWFKNKYLNISNNLKILDVTFLDKNDDLNYREIFDEENWSYTCLNFQNGNNIDSSITDIYNWFEIDDNTYDAIISNQIFQHLEFFWLTMREIERVLKPGGYVCIVFHSSELESKNNMLNYYKFHEDGLVSIAKYVNMEILLAEVNDENNPISECYGCLVANKVGTLQTNENNELKNKINNLENKIDNILETMQK